MGLCSELNYLSHQKFCHYLSKEYLSFTVIHNDIIYYILSIIHSVILCRITLKQTSEFRSKSNFLLSHLVSGQIRRISGWLDSYYFCVMSVCDKANFCRTSIICSVSTLLHTAHICICTFNNTSYIFLVCAKLTFWFCFPLEQISNHK